MPIYAIGFIGTSDMSTSAATWDGRYGSQFSFGDTITILPGADVTALSISDNDSTFDNFDSGQTASGNQSLDGTFVASGTKLNMEFALDVQDAEGNGYRLLAVTAGSNDSDILGFSFLGPMPPFGAMLTVVSVSNPVNGLDSFLAIAPACFTEGTPIATPEGPRPVESLRPGDAVVSCDSGPQRLALVVRQEFWLPEGPHPHRPVRLSAASGGAGTPLWLSPQHRVLVGDREGAEWLAPARAMAQAGSEQAGRQRYLHLVFERHLILLAGGIWAESFWPGPMAMRGLAPALRQRIGKLMPEARPARPFLGPGAARRHPGGLLLRRAEAGLVLP